MAHRADRLVFRFVSGKCQSFDFEGDLRATYSRMRRIQERVYPGQELAAIELMGYDPHYMRKWRPPKVVWSMAKEQLNQAQAEFREARDELREAA